MTSSLLVPLKVSCLQMEAEQSTMAGMYCMYKEIVFQSVAVMTLLLTSKSSNTS